MDNTQLTELIIEQLTDIAPELEGEALNQEEDMREEFDLDSMDFLNLVVAVSKKTGVSIPEVDYPNVLSINKLCAYILSKS